MSNDLYDSMTRRIRCHFRALYGSPLRLALLGIFLLAGVTNARADNLKFLLTDGTQTMTWTLPSSPIPSSYALGDFFVLNGVTVLENGVTPVTTIGIAFGNLVGPGDGGFGADAGLGGGTFFNTADYQVYSGPESAPTFIPGTYTEPATEDDAALAALFCPVGTVEADAGCGISDTWALSTSNDAPLTLTITPTPEPSTMLLLGTGLLGMMGMALRRKRLA